VAETPDKLVKKEPEGPAPDPITSRSTSSIILICALLLTGVTVWSLYDEVYGMRPWKGYQQSFVKRFDRYLARLQKRGFKSEDEVRHSDEYKRLDAAAKAARAQVQPQLDEKDRRVAVIDAQLNAISDDFQNRRGHIVVADYKIETSPDKDKKKQRDEVQKMKDEKSVIQMPAEDGSKKTVRQEFNFDQLQAKYVGLKNEKGQILAEKGELLKPSSDLEHQRDDYLKNNVTEATASQVNLTRAGLEKYDFGLKQININGDEIVDRCESCHLGIRSPITITASDMMPAGRGRLSRPDTLARAFVSHPDKELLQIHNPEKFGCSSCHWGNGRASTTVEKAHGENAFWIHPLFKKENTEAGCNQCHAADRVLQGANVLNEGKDMFYQRGCVGCHRYEGFDREADALTNTRQAITQLEDEVKANEHDAKVAKADSATARSDEEAQRLLAHAESLTVTNSQLEARIDQLNTQARYLMQDQKKVGPNLKDIRLKLNRDWVPVWLQDPQAFRPGTKMPTFWYLSGDSQKGGIVPVSQQTDERKAIAAYLWQSAFDGQIPQQQRGDPAHGEELFKTRGCLACHSIGEGDQKLGGDFAANLTRVGQKESFDYTVRWIHNPRQRFAPYCPKEHRDLTPEDYSKHNLPYVFDTARHSRCPNDGAELQVQNMTVMPNFRLSEQDARDIASFLFSLSPQQNAYGTTDASAFMEDKALADKGKALIKQYGCAGCHEIRGFEEEQRIGKELTAEGATPLERLDFALMTHKAQLGEEPAATSDAGGAATSESGGSSGDTSVETKGPRKKAPVPWYDHKGFFEHKLADPGVYDQGKEKDPNEHLRMPKPFLKPEWKTALTTFLLGSVGADGANVPASYFYNPTDQQKAIQDGWWVIKKYNCMGCHNVQVGQKSVLSGLPQYQQNGTLGAISLGPEQLPPGLMTEGARVDPDWLLRFLCDPSLSNASEQCRTLGGQPAAAGTSAGSQQQPNIGRGDTANRQSGPGGGGQQSNSTQAQAAGGRQGAGVQQGAQNARQGSNTSGASGALPAQPGENRNGVRTYLRVRMPTFSFSPNELRTLVRFFQAVSAQQEPYIKEQLEPLTDDERNLARALFTSQAAPCLKCHMTGDATHDQTATAPNFLQAGSRLKPDWTFRWLLDPQRIMPGTAMPSELFKHDADHDRWVFNGPLPPSAENYDKDHARLLVRYLLSLTPEEQARARAAIPSRAPAPSGATPTGTAPPAPVASHKQNGGRPAPAAANLRNSKQGRQTAGRASPRRARGRLQVSQRARTRRARERERWRQAASEKRSRRRAAPEGKSWRQSAGRGKWRQSAAFARVARRFSP
jgi:cytochrome c551/c552